LSFDNKPEHYNGGNGLAGAAEDDVENAAKNDAFFKLIYNALEKAIAQATKIAEDCKCDCGGSIKIKLICADAKSHYLLGMGHSQFTYR
jgi:hypothetical protein